MSNALVEQQLFECKQGIYRLDHARQRDDGVLAKVFRTMSAMANAGKGATGYVLLGVADKKADAEQIQALDGVASYKYRDFYVAGLDREAALAGLSLSDYWKWVVQQLRGDSRLNPNLAQRIAGDARLAHYKGRSVGLFKVTALAEPVFFDGELYERSGSETLKLSPTEFGRIYSRFTS